MPTRDLKSKINFRDYWRKEIFEFMNGIAIITKKSNNIIFFVALKFHDLKFVLMAWSWLCLIGTLLLFNCMNSIICLLYISHEWEPSFTMVIPNLHVSKKWTSHLFSRMSEKRTESWFHLNRRQQLSTVTDTKLQVKTSSIWLLCVYSGRRFLNWHFTRIHIQNFRCSLFINI